MRPGWVLRLAAICGYGLLLAPAVLVCAISFSAGDFLNFPPPGLSFRWYAALVSNAELMAALRNSAVLAALVAVIALLAGGPAAYAIARLEFPGRSAMAAFLAAPLLLPTLVLGLALLLALQPVKLAATWPGLVLAHAMVAIPFAVRIMTTAFGAVPQDLEEAAWTLGATPFQAALRVTLPLAAPGAIAAGALCFLVSFDETVISLFLVGPRLSTLPVEMFRYAENRTDPLVAALAMTLIVVALAVVLLVERLVGFTRAVGRN
ncbi:ABC transporter permease [Falsiroseomonas stagni]|uniref:Putative spermidine/putrescine transport system permease protein n=1 Tax=Falsiroseomonas stagni DSM 19981 TaxID=1123062 RepID=A0A1I3Y6Q7_9PROT|nr:ABC transporter permease subunit [Falsiroseomonas stagni]SFK27380.1 putative spermidine/putrescine transport system permease protein [Falsiroseomonas stagni DSM 19981]